jgi:AraC family transcriptional regulator of adaptative response / DNA-3-methyladenine glycosylase II
MASVGTGAVALAQARRAQIARTLLEQTELPVTEVAFAAGFGSLRQFNEVIKAEYGASPSELRRTPSKPDRPAQPGALTLRLPVTGGWDAARMLRFLGTRAIPGVEDLNGDRYSRSLRTPQGAAVVSVKGGDAAAHVEVTVENLSAVSHVMTAMRRLCDLSADMAAAEKVLVSERVMRELIRRRPGLRVPGAVDGWEVVVRAIVGQQVSVPAARTLIGRIVERCGTAVPVALQQGAIRSLFPAAEDVLAADLSALGLTGARVRSLHSAAAAATQGDLLLEPGDDVVEARRRLLALPGVGPWTVEYIAMRALADPDAWPATDLVLAREAAQVNVDELRPWRSYAALHLWTNVAEETS